MSLSFAPRHLLNCTLCCINYAAWIFIKILHSENFSQIFNLGGYIFWPTRDRMSKKRPRWQGYCFLDVTAMILVSISFNNEHADIHLKIYFTKIGHSVLKKWGIFWKKTQREIFKTGKKSRPNVLPILAAITFTCFLHLAFWMHVLSLCHHPWEHNNIIKGEFILLGG